MNIHPTIQIKEELLDVEDSFTPALTPALEEFYLKRQFDKEYEVGHSNDQVRGLNELDGQLNNIEDIPQNYENKFLNERDGQFKNYEDVLANQNKLPPEDDLKNYCNKCNIQFETFVASQKHYMFAHYALPPSCLPQNYENKFLDERDGHFKNYEDVPANQNKLPPEEDLKNYCNQCDIQFDTFVASQNHYMFAHYELPPSCLPPPSLPPPSLPSPSLCPSCFPPLPSIKVSQPTRKSLRLQSPMKSKIKCNNIITKSIKIKYPTKVLVQRPITYKSDTKYTLENIKVNPLKGLKVVKKTEILFDELRAKAEEKVIYTKRLEDQKQAALDKLKHERPCIRIDMQDPMRAQAKLNALTEVYRTMSKKGIVKFLCSTCNTEVVNPFTFNSYGQMGIAPNFGAQHAEICKLKHGTGE